MDHVLKFRSALFLARTTSKLSESLFRIVRSSLRQQPHWRVGSLKSVILFYPVSFLKMFVTAKTLLPSLPTHQLFNVSKFIEVTLDSSYDFNTFSSCVGLKTGLEQVYVCFYRYFAVIY